MRYVQPIQLADGWRYLRPDEITTPTDEFYDLETGLWQPTTRPGQAAFAPKLYRRRVEQDGRES